MDGKRRKWTYTSRLMGLVGVTLFLAIAFTPLPNLLSRSAATPSQLEPADAIVVLASSISPDGVLSQNSMRRALYGISLYRKGLAPLLVFSGPARSEVAVEAAVRAELARELGIPSHAILTEASARTTREEAFREKVLLQPRGVRRILLVTGSLHMRRALYVFERVGFRVSAAPVDETSKDTDDPEERLWLMREVLGEFFARAYYQAVDLFKAVEERW